MLTTWIQSTRPHTVEEKNWLPQAALYPRDTHTHHKQNLSLFICTYSAAANTMKAGVILKEIKHHNTSWYPDTISVENTD